MKAPIGDFKPKNAIDQEVFNNNCNAKKIIAAFFERFVFAVQIKYKDIPINKNKVVHTGPKTQPGGFRFDLFKFAYQLGIDFTVKIEPIAPAN